MKKQTFATRVFEYKKSVVPETTLLFLNLENIPPALFFAPATAFPKLAIGLL